MVVEREGVIKFAAEHRSGVLPTAALHLLPTLAAWRRIFGHLELVGQAAARYAGAGFGNVSTRLPPYPGDRGQRPFVITGTQTGGVSDLGPTHWCVVRAYDVMKNRVRSEGPCLPSSESMTHGAIYDLSPAIRWVFHGHCAVLWRAAADLGLPTTAHDVEYGTVGMAREVARLYRTGNAADARVIAMGGHEDGIITFGATAELAGTTLVAALATAMTHRPGQSCADGCPR